MKLPRILGINQLADETALAAEDNMFVREARNVDIDSAGNVSRRAGYKALLGGSGYHSLYSSERGWLMVAYKNELGVFNTSTNQFVTLVDMGSNYRVSYTEENGNLYASSPAFNVYFKPNDYEPYPVGAPLPNITPSFAASYSEGALLAGSYGITYSIVNPDGEESPLGPIKEIELEEQGSIVGTLFTIAVGYKYRIYLTKPNGEELYQAAEFDASTTSYTVMEQQGGRQPETQNLDVTPTGHIIRAFNSRLLVGDVDFVYFTEAFRPHLHNPAHGFVPVTGMTLMIEPVGGGVFIADRRGVRFYRGEDPEKWDVREVSPERVVFGTSAVVPGSFFTGDIAQFDDVAVWLTARGYQVGLPTGEVVSLNAGQVKLPQYVQGCTTYLIRDGRKQLISPVNSNKLADASVALDSSIN